MKHLYILILGIIMVNCSNNDDSEIEEPFVQDYNLYINGEKIDYYGNIDENNYFLRKIGNEFHFPLNNLVFNENGNYCHFFIELNTLPYNTPAKFEHFYYNSSNHLGFNIEKIDEVKKTVEGTITGYIYRINQMFNLSTQSYYPIISLNNEKKHVWCSFKLKYKNIPKYSDQYVRANINGQAWESSYFRRFYTIQNWQYFLDCYHYDNNINIQIGYFNGETLRITKFNNDTNTIDKYIGTYQLNYTPNTLNYSKGTFNFQGYNENNPNDIINITDGSFSFLY